jgi:hypothetical protein
MMVFFLIFPMTRLNAQLKYTISGSIRDSLTGEVLIGASVSISELHSGCITNAYGFYSLTVPSGDYNVNYSYIGFSQKTVHVRLNSDMEKNMELKTKTVTLNEVTVSAEAANHNVSSTEMSVQTLNIKEIKALPVLFGEQDILKTIQLLPGIKTSGEGNTGFYVRGGTADQNLVLLDEAPVYNTAHLLGFFSVFNSDAIKDVKVIKGDMPAEYGGRLSSVIDVRMNDGNSKEFGVSGGIGLISSRLTVEGPIVKDKGSFMISGRRTYADLFLKLTSDSNLRRTSLYFYDLNMKANYNFGTKDHIYISGYLGRDVFNFGNQFGINWGNVTSTFRWNHLFSNKLFFNSSLVYSNYNYVIGLQGSSRQIDINSGIRDFGLKEDFQYYLNPQNTVKFGIASIYHTFFPGSLKTQNDTSINSRIIQERKAIESGIYLSNDQEISSSVKINYGLRLSLFSIIGPGTFYSYDEYGDKSDSTVYNGTSVVKNYFGMEPRLSMTYIFDPTTSIKASYTRNYQYVHLLSNTTSGNPTDLWLPSSNNIKPQYSDQFAVGLFKNMDDNIFESSLEFYYKPMHGLIDYKPGADIILNPNVESQLLYGKGLAYGAEFFLRKREGKLTGWVGYTLSRALRTFTGIDNGNTFPAKQDEIHDISIVGIYEGGNGWTFGGTWVFNTGNAVTFPRGIYNYDGYQVPYYTNRNEDRMPPYHRLDLSATNTKKKKGKRERSWTFSIYNVYARKNAYSINFRKDPNDPTKTQAVRLSLFSIIPSVTYNFKF